MDDLLKRIWEHLIERVSGPLHFRLLLQPGVATFFAMRDGLKDAREMKPAYFWTIFTDAGQREEMMEEGWKAVSKVFVLAVLLDIVYQVVALHWLYPGEALIVAFVLAILPYLLIRGPVNRIKRW
jgi:hypothetical protein